MSSEGLRVTSERLTATASFADQVADELVNEYQRLADDVIELLDGRWTGAAADACRSAWEEWTEGFRLVVRGLHDEATAMEVSASKYDSADEQGASTIQGSTSTL
ncbi:WXG100 family type VII secretion target [Mycolicibacterium sp. P1-18]|uniref:WXG100 family type VII secretion target n=1 Tax=Mycolicibacterium sp. P1-18 TaxID=2024615 RepID=UPI0011F33AFF|nr:WXG100 family type VII secretion target [Mycolicibacterium sp. P1-18]KAA0099981.1 WXG100 family type VII secretion target [Mycolicibacterium sp. P1-18]